METLQTLIYLILFSFIFIFFTTPVHCINSCEPVSCHSTIGPIIRFPFRLADRQPARCGYPGFELYCNNQNQTILNLHDSGNFTVDVIDYRRQALLINDPDSCLPGRLLNFTLSGSRFQAGYLKHYTFLNCSGTDWINYSYSCVPLFCLYGRNYTIVAVDSHSVEAAQVSPTCRMIVKVSVPISMFWYLLDLNEYLELIWTEPASRPSRGLSRGAKYGIIIGIGIPGLICITGLTCYFCSMLRSSRSNHNLNLELATTGISEQRLAIRSTVNGLDGPTIESYPSIVLGESRRLPKPSDVTCPICLIDYEAKETLRSIPECNHYFHADCIDEWLKLNGTCPLCRNSPESSMGTPCSSMSLSSPSSSISSDH